VILFKSKMLVAANLYEAINQLRIISAQKEAMHNILWFMHAN